jgi:hypothetical protein
MSTSSWCAQTERPEVSEREDSTAQPPPDADQSATERYLEYRERMLRYDLEYLDRFKQSQPAPPPTPAKPDLPWGHPICDRCPRRIGCGLQQAMKKVDGFKAGGRGRPGDDRLGDTEGSP